MKPVLTANGLDAVPFPIRPHHALCLAFFCGHGYSDGFSANMAAVKRALDDRPDRLVVITSRADAACAACPLDADASCREDGKAARYDTRAREAMGLSEGDMLSWRELCARARERVITPGWLPSVCGDCRWHSLCAGIPASMPCAPKLPGSNTHFVLHIMGAAGAGTSTLGMHMARVLHSQWLDVDSFFWLPTDPPFTQKRPANVRLALLERALDEAGNAVISGSLCGWGDRLISRFHLVVFLRTDQALRIRRIRAREEARFGTRVLPGGDLNAAHESFVEWAGLYDTADSNIRSLALHQKWLNDCACPTLCLDGARPLDELAACVLSEMDCLSRRSNE